MGEKMQNGVEMTWKWLNKIFFSAPLLQHVPWRLLSDSFSRWESRWVSAGVNRTQISADVWGLNQSAKREFALLWPFTQCNYSYFSWSKCSDDGRWPNKWPSGWVENGGKPLHKTSNERWGGQIVCGVAAGKRAVPMFSAHPVGVQWRAKQRCQLWFSQYTNRPKRMPFISFLDLELQYSGTSAWDI